MKHKHWTFFILAPIVVAVLFFFVGWSVRQETMTPKEILVYPQVDSSAWFTKSVDSTFIKTDSAFLEDKYNNYLHWVFYGDYTYYVRHDTIWQYDTTWIEDTFLLLEVLR